ncbi:hypothetical protein KQX54_012626 [Cotesia glomerata]|uniref:Tesmin/TSO1-like CXC domain-containing protein n=1 Tax=Cotesia glomerata TaxID=32391 RepID=A0AAV7HX18_COTGL|nr:hypothetical protein KQX54_012626 [Cotesia glomerata]
MIYVMSVCLTIQWKSLKCFKDLAISFCKLVDLNVNASLTRIDFIFDSYLDLSPKSLERQSFVSNSIVLHTITEDTEIPKQKEKFWNYTVNKTLLQLFLRNYIKNNAQSLWPNVHIIFNATNHEKCTSNKSISFENLVSLQNTKVDKASLRTALHIAHAGIWILAKSSGKQKKFLPLHTVAAHYGLDFCKVLPGDQNISDSVKKADEYLVKILNKGSQCQTFDKLCNYVYYHSPKFLISDLPPTSESIQLHILRAYYMTYQYMHCVKNKESLDPCKFGFYAEENYLYPCSTNHLWPSISDLPPNCNCLKCARRTCECQAAESACIAFCKCRPCANPYSHNHKY